MAKNKLENSWNFSKQLFLFTFFIKNKNNQKIIKHIYKQKYTEMKVASTLFFSLSLKHHQQTRFVLSVTHISQLIYGHFFKLEH